MKSVYLYLFGFLWLMMAGSCGLYKNYTPAETDRAENERLLGGLPVTTDSVNLAVLPWQSLYEDELLQELIRRGLTGNTDLNIAKLRIDQAEASLKAARLAFFPSLTLTPQGAVSRFGQGDAAYTYTLPVAANWQIDLFGKLRNAKARSAVLVQQSHAYRKAVQTELMAAIATQYYTLGMLREQADVTRQSVEIRSETVRTMQLLMEAGQYNDAAVSQAEASFNQAKAAALELQQQIHEVENALSVLLGDAVQEIASNSLYDWKNPEAIQAGIPLAALAMRPDVQQSELELAAAFYATNEARAAFYPDLTLSGSLGWSNVAGIISNPGKLLTEALASLTQPVFRNGQLKANYKIAASRREEAALNFRQTLLQAGMEVNNAYTQVQTYAQRAQFCKEQVLSLQRTVRSTQLLMQHGSTGYLEVLSAQDQLLTAQLEFVANQFREISACISLYQALGGGLDCA